MIKMRIGQHDKGTRINKIMIEGANIYNYGVDASINTTIHKPSEWSNSRS
jgi:hypothetical protein